MLTKWICAWLAKHSEWGYDEEEGDATLRLGPFYFTLYKWGRPIVHTGENGFVGTGDSHTKELLWRPTHLEQEALQGLVQERIAIVRTAMTTGSPKESIWRL